jgi:hypothetical protein
MPADDFHNFRGAARAISTSGYGDTDNSPDTVSRRVSRATRIVRACQPSRVRSALCAPVTRGRIFLRFRPPIGGIFD